MYTLRPLPHRLLSMEQSRLHDELHDQEAVAQSGHQRAKKACSECRKRKRKCDRNTPCYACAQNNYDCVFDEDTTPDQQSQQPLDEMPDGDDPSQPTLLWATSGSNVSQSPAPSLNSDVIEVSIEQQMDQSSSMSSPSQMSVELKAAHPLRLHSLGWNCGIRAEEPGSIHASLTDYITWEDCQHFVNIYFDTVNKSFHLFDKQQFLKVCGTYFNWRTQDFVLGALIGGVVSIGSLFASDQGHPLEPQIVKHVKDILEDSTFSRLPSMDQVNAWILRTLYLRATARPHLTWISSCTVMHLVEAVGLHPDSEPVTQSGPAGAQHCEGNMRTFWVAWFVNTIIAYEYGRSNVRVDDMDRQPAPFDENSDTGLLIHMARILPSERTNADVVTVSKSLEAAIQKLLDLGEIESYPSLARGDLCFCLYRRLRLLKVIISKETLANIITIGRAAVEAAIDEADRNVPWWNILGTPFQFLCVLLSMDSSLSLSEVAWVSAKLDHIAEFLNTQIATEVISMASTLMNGAWAKKREHVLLLEMSDDDDLSLLNRQPTPDWDTVLNPFYVVGDFDVKDAGI